MFDNNRDDMINTENVTYAENVTNTESVTNAENATNAENITGTENVTNTENFYTFYTDSFTGQQAVSQEPPVKEKKPSAFKKVVKKGAILLASAAVFGVVAGSGFVGIQHLMHFAGSKDTEQSTNAAQNTTIAQGNPVQTITMNGNVVTDVSDVVEAVMPSIVAINSTSIGTTYDWFGRPYQNEEYGSGSGIIIGQSDEEIMIVTNNHVIDGATIVEIVFDDDSKAKASVKGAEASSDLAVVAVRAKDLSDETLNHIKVATLGDSSAMRPGELVIAIGNALGYGQSVTVGYVSALDREVKIDKETRKLLQTDAAINPGNSGGALLNAYGQVIGINSVKYASEEVEGIGFAIPVNDAIPIINNLMNREDLNESEMGFLGIADTTDVTEAYAQAFNMPIGVFVQKVVEDSPAQAAGVRSGYIITGINDTKIETRDALQQTLSYLRAGTTITLHVQVLENGTYVAKELSVTLTNRPVE